MRIKATDPDAMQYKVIDLDTGEPLELVLEADDQTGIYTQGACDSNGKFTCDDGGKVKAVTKRGNICIVPRFQKVVFVSGPYTAPTREEIKKNIAIAEEIGQRILAAGHIPIIPHKISSFWDEKGPLTDWQHDDWLTKFCLPLMHRCDAVFMVPGWEKSTGASREYLEAGSRGKPIYFTVEALA